MFNLGKVCIYMTQLPHRMDPVGDTEGGPVTSVTMRPMERARRD